MRIKFIGCILILLFAFLNLNADINAKYYRARNSVDSDERNWQGPISHTLTDSSPCYSKRVKTCFGRDTDGQERGENCYTYTYSPDPKQPSLFRDRIIHFIYDSDIRGRGVCFDTKSSYFRHPLPILATVNTWGVSASAWSAVWDGNVKIPSDGTWHFAVSLIGEAVLEIWNKDDTENAKPRSTFQKKYVSHGLDPTYTSNYANGITVLRLRKGDVIKFKLKYSTTGKNQLIWLQWFNSTNPGSTPRSAKLPSYTSIQDIGQMGVIPYNYLVLESPKPKKEFEYKVVEKQYVQKYMQANKSFDWLWKSPLRTKVAGKQNEYCLLAGVKNSNGTYSALTEEKSAYVALLYNIIEENRNSVFTTKAVKYPLRNTQGRPILFKTKTSAPYVDYSKSCFSLITDRVITKSAKFIVSEKESTVDQINVTEEEKKITNSNNLFAIRPAGYKISFTDDSNTQIVYPKEEVLIKNIPSSTAVLTAGKPYTLNITAQAVNFNSNKDLHTFRDINLQSRVSQTAKYTTQIKDTKLIPQSNGLTCTNINEVNLGKPVNNEAGKYGLVFRDGAVKFKSTDFVGPISNEGLTALKIPFFYNRSSRSYQPYVDVMKFKTQIVDTDWAEINFKDIKDYRSLTGANKKSVEDYVKEYGYQCSGYNIPNLNSSNLFKEGLEACSIDLVSPAYVEFIPAKFEVDMSTITNGANGFTYVNDINATDITSDNKIRSEHTMLPKLTLNIKAIGANSSGRLSNFSKNCYATDINATISYKGDKYINDLARNPSSITNQKLISYLAVKQLFAYGNDINASRRIIFDENSTYKANTNATIEFNKNHHLFKRANYNTRSMTYSDYNKTNHTNNAYYTISKNLFSLQDGSAVLDIGFNFARSNQTPHNPFIVAPIEFDIGDMTYRSHKINSEIKYPEYSGYDSSKVTTMLYGMVYAPFYEGPASGFEEKIYYGFYNSNGCKSNSNLEFISGENLPQNPNYCSNLKHNNYRYGYWQTYDKKNHTNMTRLNPTTNVALSQEAPSFVEIRDPQTSKVIHMVEMVRFSNTKATRDEIKLMMPKFPWLINNIAENANYNEFSVLFHDTPNFNDWGGKAYNSSGEETGVGSFMFKNNEAPLRTNRRIDW